MAEKKVSPEYAVGKVSHTLRCSICMMILHDPVETPCNHVFCRDCIEGFIDTGDSPSCTNDRKKLRKQDLKAAPLCLSQLLQELEIHCPEFGAICRSVKPSPAQKLLKLADHGRTKIGR
ncbi:unnamed protein product [Cyprideis torosa]|uniref:Uncharacterized protein n=1 Tax=Cyprideis torosa TaxID=163714 RepID=A0A7R8ZN87_9CRUS|nr:unnamed protein product [Cyprideis torosa]CAG0890997.1 unnamed protein product [Cyprideis torosa]